MSSESIQRSLDGPSATAVVMSNMIGAGVFTSLGLQAVEVHSGFALLLLWAIGGLVACCGALAYAELGAAFPRSGGEYVYLSRLYGPAAGFLGGWVTMTVAVATPIAIAGIAFGRYLGALTGVSPLAAALAVVLVVAAIQLGGLRLARWFQLGLTGLTLLLLVAFIGAGLFHPTPEPISFAPTAEAWRDVFRPGYGVALIYVSYAFLGWNAAGFIAGEITEPGRTIPRVLIVATVSVTLLYLLLNWTFLRTVPFAQIPGTVEIGARSATAMFGPTGGLVMSGAIALLLIATISAMVLGGTRVTAAVFAGTPALQALGARAANGVPRNATLVQLGFIALLLLTNSFELVITYAGFTMTLMMLLIVVGLVRLRRTEPALTRPFRMWGYPVTAALFLLLNLWTLGFTIWQRPLATAIGLATLLVGFIVFRGLSGSDEERTR
jgi:APA family basic amino acid/polyamine antiporter